MHAAIAADSKAVAIGSFPVVVVAFEVERDLAQPPLVAGEYGLSHHACLLRERIVVFIAITSSTTTRSRSPEPASESEPPGFALGSPLKKERASTRPSSTRVSPSSRSTRMLDSLEGIKAIVTAFPANER
jgi:hypothetical protein